MNTEASSGRAQVLELNGEVADLSGVRRWTRSTLAGLHPDELFDVLLVVTELVSNVYDHSRFPARLRLNRSAKPCVVTVSVDDASAKAPVLRPSSSDSPRGRGMVIVNRLAERWGVVQHAIGKSVWALIPCPLTS